MLRGGLMVDQRRMIVSNPEIRASFDPDVIGQAGMNVGRIEVLLRMRCLRQDGLIDVRRKPAALDRGPVLVLHYDDPHGFYMPIRR